MIDSFCESTFFRQIHFQDYPSITWKLQNLLKLKDRNHAKLKKEVAKLATVFQ